MALLPELTAAELEALRYCLKAVPPNVTLTDAAAARLAPGQAFVLLRDTLAFRSLEEHVGEAIRERGDTSAIREALEPDEDA